jgi:hypothetical protein
MTGVPPDVLVILNYKPTFIDLWCEQVLTHAFPPLDFSRPLPTLFLWTKLILSSPHLRLRHVSFQTTHVHDQWEPKVFKNTSPKVITAKRVKSDHGEEVVKVIRAKSFEIVKRS